MATQRSLVGVDYGTTFSTFSVTTMTTTSLYLRDGSEFIPSLLGIDGDNINVGYGVLNHDGTERDNYAVYRDMKRWIGVTSKTYISKIASLNPQYTVRATDDMMAIAIGSCNKTTYGTQLVRELVARYVSLCVNDFARERDFEVSGLVISVPAKYSTSQRLFMKNLESLVGIDIVHIMNEPSAALFASVFERIPALPAEYYIVYDFGGGTFDVSVVGRMGKKYSVIYSGGDDELGGRDVDRKISEFLKSKFSIVGSLGFDLSLMKEEICANQNDAVRHCDGKEVRLTYQELYNIVQPFLERANQIMIDTYVFSGLRKPVYIVPIGGSSALPGAVMSNLAAMGRNAIGVIKAPRNRSAVAEGCSLFSAALNDPESLFVDCVTSNISVHKNMYQAKVVVPSGAPLPISVKYTTECRGKFSWEVGMYEGSANRLYNNTQLTRYHIDKKVLNTTTDYYDYDTHIDINSMGIISITVTCSVNSTVLTFGVRPVTYTKLRPRPEVNFEREDKSSLRPLVTKDFIYASLHKKVFDFVEFTDYLSYHGKLLLASNNDDLSFNVFSRRSAIANGATSLSEFLAVRGLIPEFLRNKKYIDFPRHG